MQEISIGAVAAPQMVAEAIEGFGPKGLAVTRGKDSSLVPSGQELTRLALGGVSVMIWRPRSIAAGQYRPATVAWMTSSLATVGVDAAEAQAELLAFAVRVCRVLDGWAETGQLPRLNEARAV